MIENKPLVSVIMNCYNSDTYLEEAINSVLNQTYQNFEIIFWDNQSTDKSAEIAKSYDDERIKYFYAPTFTPLYEARNYAIEKASGKYIAFLDCDDLWYDTKLEKQVLALEDSKYKFCYTNFYEKYGKKLKIKNTRHQLSGNIYQKQLGNYSIGILTVMLDKKAFMEMDEKFDKSFTYPGDFDFFIRFLYKYRAIYINELLAEYRADNPSSISNNKTLEDVIQLKKVVNKLEKLFLNKDTKKEFIKLSIKVSLQESGYYFRNKKYKECQIILKQTKNKNIKSFILYLLTFLPKNLLNYLVKVI